MHRATVSNCMGLMHCTFHAITFRVSPNIQRERESTELIPRVFWNQTFFKFDQMCTKEIIWIHHKIYFHNIHAHLV